MVKNLTLFVWIMMLLCGVSLIAGDDWTENFEEAKAEAVKRGLPILILPVRTGVAGV